MDTIHTLNENLIALFDESGVTRSFTVPYDEVTYEHVIAVGHAAHKAGGFTNNLLLVGDGYTVAYSSEVLGATTIRKDSEPAKSAIATAREMIGDGGPADKKAVLGILDLVGQLAGISLLDFAVAIIQLVSCPTIPSDMFTLPSASVRGQKASRIQQMLLVAETNRTVAMSIGESR
jgi:hypothetical protein